MTYFIAYLLVGLACTLAHTFLKKEFMESLDEDGVFDHVFEPAVGMSLAARAIAILLVGSLLWPYWIFSELVHKWKGEES
jgi:hypothetical protein